MKTVRSRTSRIIGLRRASMLALLGFALALVNVSELRAQSFVGLPEVNPKFVKAGGNATVTVTVRIANPNVDPNSVKLDQVDSKGNVLKPLGPMNDNGLMGDLKKNDQIYTTQFNQAVLVGLKTGSPALLRVSATLKGTGQTDKCGQVPVTVVDSFLEPKDFTPDGLRQYLMDNNIKTVAAFLQRLDPAAGFQHDWIMMSRTQSAQKATAEYPRFILQNSDATAVFGVATLNGFRDVIEYIQWDSATNRFRFHSIDPTATDAAKIVDEDDKTCYRCHSGPGTIDPKLTDWPYPRPNWDAYDSWGGALPFNRDRIYIGNPTNSEPPSIEQAAMQRLLKSLVNDKDPAVNDVTSQLALPEGITRACDGTITIVPDPIQDGAPAGLGEDIANPKTHKVTYQVEGEGKKTEVLFPGDDPKKQKNTQVQQGLSYLTMHDTFKGFIGGRADEGRGVALFDSYSALNAQRVAQEVADKYAAEKKDDKVVVDIRPVALAIAGGGDHPPADPCKLDGTNLTDYAPQNALDELFAYFKVEGKDNEEKFTKFMAQTLKLRQSLPQLKAELEARNLANLIVANNNNNDMVDPVDIVNQVARRSVYGLPSQISPPPDNKEIPFRTDPLTKFMIDREQDNKPGADAGDDQVNLTIALFRLFLQPSHEPVNKWSLSVLSRSSTYTFGDVFNLPTSDYPGGIAKILNDATFGKPGDKDQALGSTKTCDQLAADSKAWFKAAMATDPNYFKP